MVQEGPREEEIVESDNEEEEILEERDAVPLRIRIASARARGGPLAAAMPARIDPGMWFSMGHIKLPPHLADLEVESMEKFILDHKRYSQAEMSTTIATKNAAIYPRGGSWTLSVTKTVGITKKSWN